MREAHEMETHVREDCVREVGAGRATASQRRAAGGLGSPEAREDAGPRAAVRAQSRTARDLRPRPDARRAPLPRKAPVTEMRR